MIIATFAIICLFIFFIGIYLINDTLQGLGEWLTTNYGCLGDEPYSTTVIEQMGNFTLPSSAQNLQAASDAFQDCFIFIRFEMSPDDLEALLASSYVQTVNPTRGDELHIFYNWMGNSVDWQFSKDELYPYGTGGNEMSGHQAIVIDTSDAEQYKVYIITALF